MRKGKDLSEKKPKKPKKHRPENLTLDSPGGKLIEIEVRMNGILIHGDSFVYKGKDKSRDKGYRRFNGEEVLLKGNGAIKRKVKKLVSDII